MALLKQDWIDQNRATINKASEQFWLLFERLVLTLVFFLLCHPFLFGRQHYVHFPDVIGDFLLSLSTTLRLLFRQSLVMPATVHEHLLIEINHLVCICLQPETIKVDLEALLLFLIIVILLIDGFID